MKLLCILIPALLLAQDEAEAKKPPKLKDKQKLELLQATATVLRSEVAIHRLKDDYEREKQQRIDAAKQAAREYDAVVKRLSKLVPEGYELQEGGEIVAKPATPPKQ